MQSFLYMHTNLLHMHSHIPIYCFVKPFWSVPQQQSQSQHSHQIPIRNHLHLYFQRRNDPIDNKIFNNGFACHFCILCASQNVAFKLLIKSGTSNITQSAPYELSLNCRMTTTSYIIHIVVQLNFNGMCSIKNWSFFIFSELYHVIPFMKCRISLLPRMVELR